MKYIIPKNWHYSLSWNFFMRWIPIYIKDEITFEIKFDDSIKKDINPRQINKLIGLRPWNKNVHTDSVRVGFEYESIFDQDFVNNYGYFYKDKIREIKFIRNNEINSFYPITISIDKSGWYCLCMPYFGGQIKAPNVIKIEINMLTTWFKQFKLAPLGSKFIIVTLLLFLLLFIASFFINIT